MKIYICDPEAVPILEVDIAILLEADIAMVDRSPLTILYAIKKDARRILFELPFKKVNSEVHESTWACVLNLDATKEYLEKRFEIEYVTVETPN